MGELRFKNGPLTSGMLLGLDVEMELLWKHVTGSKEGAAVEERTAFVCIGFGAGLGGEEVTLTSLKGMIQFWEETMNDKDDPNVMVNLYGRFKGETGFRWHCLPICNKNRSGIPFRKWIGRLMHTRLFREGKSGGWLFINLPIHFLNGIPTEGAC